MGERAECPVCGAYSSDILNDIRNGNNCRRCECPHDLLKEYQDVLERKDLYKKNKISNEIIEENDRLIKENAKFKTKLEKMEKILGYSFDSPLLDSIKNILKILHDEEK